MKDKIFNILLIVFSLLFLIYPASYGMIDLKISFLFIVVIVSIFYFLKKIRFKININEKYYPYIIICLCFITRVIIVLIFNSYISQVSNFRDALNAAQTLNFSSKFYKIFSHWTLYPFILHCIFKIFGTSQLVALLTNSVILTINSFLIYKIGSVVANKKLGFISSIIYIIWPANILYTLIVNPENLGISLLLFSTYLFLRLEYNTDLSQKRKILDLVIIGTFLGLSVFFKNFAPVLIIAFIIYYFLFVLKNNGSRKFLISKVVSIIIIFVMFTLSKQIMFLAIDNLVGTKVARNIVPGFLNIGLRGDGTLSENRWVVYEELLNKYDYDFKLANKEMTNSLIEDIKNNDSAVRKKGFFENKANILFGGDYTRIDYVILSLGNHTYLKSLLSKYIIPLNNIFYIGVITFMVIEALFLMKQKNLGLILLEIIIHGCALMLIIVEAQNRYMYSIQPFMCILASNGIITLKKEVCEKFSI